MKTIVLTDAQADYLFHLVNTTNSFHDQELPFMADVMKSMRDDGHSPRRADHTRGIIGALINPVEG